MSRLYASIDADASKTQATRRGHRNISAHVRGWDSGVEVVASADETGDRFEVYVTTGSNGRGARLLVGTVQDGAFERVISATLPRPMEATA